MKAPQTHFDLVHYQGADPFGDVIGYEVLKARVRPGSDRVQVDSRMRVLRQHLSAAGRIHGGALMSFMDFACGAAVFASLEREDQTATVELKTHFFAQVFEGEVLLARSTLLFRGKRIAVARAEITTSKTGKRVGYAVGTYNIRPGVKDSGAADKKRAAGKPIRKALRRRPRG